MFILDKLMLEAAQARNILRVKGFITSGADILAQDIKGNTVATIFASHGDFAAVVELVKIELEQAEAKVNKKKDEIIEIPSQLLEPTKTGTLTPAEHFAAKGMFIEVCRLPFYNKKVLEQANVLRLVACNYGVNEIVPILRAGFKVPSDFREIIRKRKIWKKDIKNQFVMLNHAGRNDISAVLKKIEAGANILAQDHNGDTVATIFAKQKNVSAIEELINIEPAVLDHLHGMRESAVMYFINYDGRGGDTVLKFAKIRPSILDHKDIYDNSIESLLAARGGGETIIKLASIEPDIAYRTYPRNGKNAVMKLAETTDWESVVELIRVRPSTVTHMDKFGNNVMITLATRLRFEAIEEIAKINIEALDQSDCFGNNITLTMMVYRKIEYIIRIAKLKPDILSHRDIDGYTTPMELVSSDNIDGLKVLAEHFPEILEQEDVFGVSTYVLEYQPEPKAQNKETRKADRAARMVKVDALVADGKDRAEAMDLVKAAEEAEIQAARELEKAAFDKAEKDRAVRITKALIGMGFKQHESLEKWLNGVGIEMSEVL